MVGFAPLGRAGAIFSRQRVARGDLASWRDGDLQQFQLCREGQGGSNTTALLEGCVFRGLYNSFALTSHIRDLRGISVSAGRCQERQILDQLPH